MRRVPRPPDSRQVDARRTSGAWPRSSATSAPSATAAPRAKGRPPSPRSSGRPSRRPRTKAAKKNGDKAIEPGAVIRIPDPTDNRRPSAPRRPSSSRRVPKLAGGALPPGPRRLAHVAERTAISPRPQSIGCGGTCSPAASSTRSRRCTRPTPRRTPRRCRALAAAFARPSYDVKFVLRALCNTKAYQRTSRPLPDNADDDQLLSHMPVKVIGAPRAARFAGRGHRLHGAAGPGSEPAEEGQGSPGRCRWCRFFDTREYDDDATEFAYGVPQVLKLMNTARPTAPTRSGASCAGRRRRPAAGGRRPVRRALGRRPRATRWN